MKKCVSKIALIAIKKFLKALFNVSIAVVG